MIPLDESFPSLVWPDNLQTIRFTEGEKDCVVQFIKSIWPGVKTSQTTCINFMKGVQGPLKLPVSLSFHYDAQGRVEYIVLLLNRNKGHALTCGGQRQPKTCYELTRGWAWVKKHELGNEQAICDYLSVRSLRGLSRVFARREIDGKKQFFEKFHPGTLEDWIGTRKLRGVRTKLFIISSLLEGLVQLRRLIITQTVDGTSSFHGDITLANILISAWEPVLNDFGFSNVLDGVCASPLYNHPSYVFLKHLPPAKLAPILARQGGARDMWSMGIVIGTLIRNYFAKLTTLPSLKIPPFDFVVKMLDPSSRSVNFYQVRKLNQNQVDQELLMLRRMSSSTVDALIVDALWDLVADMLKIDLNKIIEPEEALARVNTLLAETSPTIQKFVGLMERIKRLQLSLKETQLKIEKLIAQVNGVFFLRGGGIRAKLPILIHPLSCEKIMPIKPLDSDEANPGKNRQYDPGTFHGCCAKSGLGAPGVANGVCGNWGLPLGASAPV